MELRRISPRLWIARQVVLATVGVPILAVALVFAITLGGAGGVAVVAGAVAVLATLWSVERGRYRSWGYVERADDLVVQRGIFIRKLSVVPYGRMQFIDVTAGPVDRLFGLATVQLHTAAAATDARIPGLLRSDADALRDRLTTIGEARATGL